MGWRDYAKEKQGAGHTRHDRHDSVDFAPSVPSVPSVPNVPGVLPLNPSRALKGWRKSVAALDPCQPAGMEMGRWQTLYDGAVWFLDTFGEQAARDGWSTADLFGLRAGYPGAGGLVERLGDNRGLVMVDGRASWRSWGVPIQFNRGGGDGLPAFWEPAV